MLWIKAFHIIFVICWFAGIFYLPRLFVYHAQSQHPETRAQLAIMERKLFLFITPFAVITIVLGAWLTSLNPGYYFGSRWFWVKLLLVTLLLAYHIYCGVLVKRFTNDSETRSHLFFRWFNEAPVLALFIIVIMAVVKPL